MPTTFEVPQEMKSFWGEYWCGPDEIIEGEWRLIATYNRHDRVEIAADVRVMMTANTMAYAVCSGGLCARTPSRIHAAQLCRWLQLGEIELVS